MIAPRGQSSVSTACSKCGGTTREIPGRRYLQCQYCDSLVFPGSNGLTTDGITPTGDELDSGCPCCQSALRGAEIAGHKALYCNQCYGILFRNAAFAEVVRAAPASSPAGPLVAQPIDPQEYERHINCPGCQGKMETHPYYGPGQVVIDSCMTCGYIWLDHGELVRLQQAAAQSQTVPPAETKANDLLYAPSPDTWVDPSAVETLFNLFT